MKTAAILVFILAIGGNISAQNEWDDVNITQLNRETAHTLAIPFGNEADALSGKSIEESPYFLSLNGVWKFNWVQDPSRKPTGFEAIAFDDTAWDNIDVPSVWQIYGVRNGKKWDKPLYVNFRYPFTYTQSYSVMADRPSDWTYNNAMKNPVGSYRRTFTLPAEWDGREVYIRFNGAGHGFYLWINGQQVGYSEDSYLPAEFKITGYLQAGENTVAVQVYRFTSASFLECQDYWRLTGISRDVFLWSAPATQIRDYFFKTDLDANYRNAQVSIDVQLTGAALANGKIKAIISKDGSPLAVQTLEEPIIGTNTLTFSVENPEKWSAERPNLYDLSLQLTDNDNTLDLRGGKVGFREVGIGSKGELLINGKRMIFHGVNRHDHSEIGGRTVTREEMERDVKTMKRLNINAVRTSHYPNNPYFYDLCDKYGIYVLAEANVECHGNTNLSSVEVFRKPMVERNQNHVLWMRNQVSIFMWSYGNESGNGSNFQYVENAIKALDRTRLTHYEGNSQWADVSSTMYASVNSIKNTGEARLTESRPRPHIQCENSHAMGNAMGNVREYFDLYEKYPSLTGEFIWEWKDHSIQMPVPNNSNGETYWAYGGDFGENPHDGNFCADGLVFADHGLSSKSYNTKKVYQPVDFRKKSENQYIIKSKLAFETTAGYDFYYSVLEDGKVINTVKLDNILLAAGDSTEVTIVAAPENARPDAEYFIRFSVSQKNATDWAENGYEVASEQFVLQTALKSPYPLPSEGELSIQEANDKYTVTGANFSVEFSKLQGALSAYVLNGKSLISNPLKLNVFRLPTDNDKTQTATWDATGIRQLSVSAGNWSIENVGSRITLNITNTYAAVSSTVFKVKLSFTVMSDGAVFVNSLIEPQNKNMILPRTGFRLEMPAGFENLTWFGRGPQDSYSDRKEAAFEGLYHSTVMQQWERYALPQETGNKENTRWMALTDPLGDGILYVSADEMAASATHFRPEDLYVNQNSRAKHPYQANLCANTVVNLDARMRGLGNASCGPDVLDKYELKAETMPFSFIILPLSGASNEEQLLEKARIAMPICAPVLIERNTEGKITLTTSTPNALINYAIDEGVFQSYSGPFDFKQSGTIRAYASAGGLIDGMTCEAKFNLHIDKSAWKVVSYSSQASNNEAAANAIDGKENTIWHTIWGNNEPVYPHEIVIDMAKTYRIESFVYQGRSDGTNGHIKDYEVTFSNHPEVWGSPALRGQFANTSARQTIAVPSKPEARYFKLLARSEVENRAWASAAELGIEASAVVPNREETCAAPVSSKTYYIKHVASGLYLQYKRDQSSHYEGDFCLNTLNRADKNFCYTFIPVPGFAGLYRMRVESQELYLNRHDGNDWRVVLGSKIDNGGRIRLEFQNECQVTFRSEWYLSRSINLDGIIPGSYIYADKSTAALWQLEEEGSTAVQTVKADFGPKIYRNPTSGKLHIFTSGDSLIKIMDFSGRLLKSYSSFGSITVNMPYPDGIYFVSIVEKETVFTQKIVLH